MEKKSQIVIFIFLVFILFFSCFLYVYVNEKSRPKPELIIYKNSNTDGPYTPSDSCCKSDEIYKKISTENYNATLLDISEDNKYILINDGNVLKILNTENDLFQTINIDNKYKMYKLQTLDNALYGITCYKEKNNYKTINGATYYNINTKQIMYEDTFSEINIKEKDYLEATYKNDTKVHILDANTEKIYVVDPTKETEEYTYRSKDNEEVQVIYDKKTKIYTLNNKNGEIIEENLKAISYLDNIIYGIKDKQLIKYDFKGTIIKTEDLSNYNIDYLTMNYGIFIDDNKLTLIDLETKKTYELTEIKSNYTYANIEQGYKETGLHDNFQNKDGIYIYLEDTSVPKSDNTVIKIDLEIRFDLKTKETEMHEVNIYKLN